MLRLIGAILLLVSCTNRDTSVDKHKLLGLDYRLFQNTPAWNLAKSVQDENEAKVRNEIKKKSDLINFRDPIYGQTLLKLAVMNKNYKSVKLLLELGADPNMKDLYFGDSPLMAAANIGINSIGADPKYLNILLKYAGNPNATEKGLQKQGRETVLIIACATGNLEYVKILVNAGANINTVTEYGETALCKAIDIAGIYENPDIVIYLIEKGADYKRSFLTTDNGEKYYITNGMREWHFDVGSKAYHKKMKLVDFLKKNGMDYRKVPIPKEFLNDYSKEYLERY